MKYVCTILMLVLIINNGKAQEIEWIKLREKPAGTSKAILTDKEGNIYEYGGNPNYFQWQNSNIQQKTFLHKYNKEGEIVFKKQWPMNFFFSEIIYDGEGHFYFAGKFNENHNYNGKSVSGKGELDGMLGKMDLEGNIKWLKSISGTDRIELNGILANFPSSELFVCGNVKGSIFIEEQAMGNYDQSILIASFDLDGNYKQHKTIDFFPDTSGIYGMNRGLEIKADKKGGYYLLFDREGYHPLESRQPITGRYLARLNPDLEFTWSTYVNGPSCYYGFSCGNLKVDSKGDPYLLSLCEYKYGGSGVILQFDQGNGNSKWSYGNQCQLGYNDYLISNDKTYFLTGNEGADIYPGPGSTGGYQVIKIFNEDKNVWGETRFSSASIQSITEDNEGNIYVIGKAKDGAVFGKDTFQIKDPSYSPLDGFFIGKINRRSCTPVEIGVSLDYEKEKSAYFFCQGSEVELEVKGEFQETYWSDGENKKTKIIVDQAGDYWIRAINKEGCTSVSAPVKLDTFPAPPKFTLCTPTFEFWNNKNSLRWRKDGFKLKHFNVYVKKDGGVIELLEKVENDNMWEQRHTDFITDPFSEAVTYTVTSVNICEAESPFSDPVETLHLDLIRDENEIYLKWNKIADSNAVNYTLYKGESLATLEEITKLPMNQDSYKLPGVPENDEYYYLKITRKNNCFHWQDSNWLKVDGKEDEKTIPTAVNEHLKKLARIYPNPTENHFTIEFPADGNYTVSLYSLSGTVLEKEKIRQGASTSFSLEKYQPGLYFLSVEDGERTGFYKVIRK